MKQLLTTIVNSRQRLARNPAPVSVGLAAIIITAIIGIFLPLSGLASTDIVDVSYEHCTGSGSSGVVSSVGHHTAGIVGVNDGSDWTKNPCLGGEIHHFSQYTLYANTNYPSNRCPSHVNRENAYNCGYNLGIWDLKYAQSQGAYSNIWWLDVEAGPGIPWSGKDSLNQTFLWGLASALETHGAPTVGYYSNGSWDGITGSWRNNNVAWLATGETSASAALSGCRRSFTGSFVVFTQYVVGGVQSGLDHDADCRNR